jgi:steroid delta-isomerase-like uncharacterized protein
MTEAFAKADAALLEQLLSSDVVNHGSPSDRRNGIEAFAQTAKLVKAVAPDQRFEVEDVIAEGDKVAIRCIWSGTQAGPFQDMPATDKRFAVQHIHIFRLDHGKVKEHWAVRDDLGLARQLGLWPRTAFAPDTAPRTESRAAN